MPYMIGRFWWGMLERSRNPLDELGNIMLKERMEWLRVQRFGDFRPNITS